MNFFRIFNVIYKLFSKRGRKALVITLVIIFFMFIFTYSKVFAYSDSEIIVTYSPRNVNVTIDNSSNFLNNYSYCYISQSTTDTSSQGAYVKLWFTSEPIYYSNGTGGFIVANNGIGTYVYFSTYSERVFTFDNTDFTSSTAETLSNSGALYPIYASVNNSIYNDENLTQVYNGSLPVTYSSDFISADNSNNSNNNNNIDYSNTLNHIDEQVTSTNTTIDNIDNNVYEIKVILQGQNTNDVVNAVSSSSATTQNIISNTSSTTQAMIQNQTSQSQSQFNTLISNTYDDSDVTLPSDNNTDITSNGFDAIFTAIYNAMTANTYSVIEIPVPYCNESIYIDPNAIRQAFDNTIVTNLIGAFYYFLVGLFIYKDIAKIIQKIKDGSIATSSDTNIKTTML